MRRLRNYFTKGELVLWCSSLVLILLSFIIFDREGYLTLIASLIGATSLIFNAKGNPFGQFLMIVFSLIYGYISFGFAYYGEMITYLGMTTPMALVALITWLAHPYNGKRYQVEVGSIGTGEWIFMTVLTAVVTVVFYFILERFDTANMIPSTVSVTTSFIAVYLTFRRSPYFPLAYGANDIVLIILWVMATLKEHSYLSVVVCFVMFLVNDLYGFINWRRMQKRQKENVKEVSP